MRMSFADTTLAKVCLLGLGLMDVLSPTIAMAECSGEGFIGSVAIPDSGSVSRSINVGETGLVTSIVVSIGLSHPFLADLDISLTSPDGTVVDLSSDNLQPLGINGSITFDDTAAQSVVGASAPLQSTYRPEQPLSTFAGEGLSGSWTLTIADDASDDVGTLEGWSISYCYTPGAEEGEGSNEGTPEGEGDSEQCSGEGFLGTASIPDQGSVSRSITVGETGLVTSIVVSIGLNHPFLADLDISLTSPDGTVVDLSSDNLQPLGINGSITFDDTAAQSVVGASAPLQSTYRPEQPLSILAGEGMSGSWTLTIADDASDDVGTLEGWSISYCYSPGIEEGEGSNEGTPDGEGDPELCSGEG